MRFPRLLLVEDDLASIFALRQFFAISGYEVDCAAGPVEGLRLLNRYAYDAVITDLHLRPAESDGMRIAGYARFRNPRACVVMLTANGSPEVEAEARRFGVDLYHVKPVDLARLSASIARVVVLHNPDVPPVPEDALSDLEGQGA
jgi:DNA-binding response OmpR family regulator